MKPKEKTLDWREPRYVNTIIGLINANPPTLREDIAMVVNTELAQAYQEGIERCVEEIEKEQGEFDDPVKTGEGKHPDVLWSDCDACRQDHDIRWGLEFAQKRLEALKGLTQKDKE
uniref:Uncharacterized protein n=1 Tax=viral metagenome TaxID=1070528 RepID=A0A6M3J6G4_9ZZZZ